MKKDIIKTVRIETERYIDFDTAEQRDVSINEIKVVVNSDDFALIYAGLWDVILGNPLSKADIEMFGYLIQNYADGTPFTITSYIKKCVADKANKSITTYDRTTSVLLKHQLIFSVDGKRTYKINPRYAYKGSSNNRKSALINMKETCVNC